MRIVVRADAGFWSYRLVEDMERLRVGWSITIGQHSQVKAAIANIEDTAWQQIDYPEGGVAEVAETAIVASKKWKHRRIRVVVRRTRLTDPEHAQLWPDWRYHAFATNSELSPVEADTHHRAHARMELAIRDIKQNAGLSHCPSAPHAHATRSDTYQNYWP